MGDILVKVGDITVTCRTAPLPRSAVLFHFIEYKRSRDPSCEYRGMSTGITLPVLTISSINSVLICKFVAISRLWCYLTSYFLH